MSTQPNYLIDLHSHTTRSDGSDTPQEFISNAAALGMKVIVITDHDVLPPDVIEVNGVMVDPVLYAQKKGMKLLPGIEFSCESLVEDVHLVVLGCDYTNPKILEMNEKIVQSKIRAYQKLLEVLESHGYLITWDEVLNYDDIPRKSEDVQKKIIFNLMAEKGYTKTWSDAKLLVRNNPEFSVKRDKPDAREIIDLAHESGGIAILAHPYLIDDVVNTPDGTVTRETFINQLIANGLDGIEASYTYDKSTYTGKMTKDEIVEKVKADYADKVKIISGGSDYHADYKKTDKKVRSIGECGITQEYFENNELLRNL